MNESGDADSVATGARLDAMQRQLDVLVAKEHIRDVLYRYARGVDRKDVDLLKSCYHPDSIDAHWSFIGSGFEFSEEILEPHQMGQVPVFKHFITNILIELDGDRAFCESSYLFSQTIGLTRKRHAALTSEGRYLDVFERRNGEWRILHRLLVPESGNWSLPVPTPGPVGFPMPTCDQCTGWFPNDPVYRGFGISEILPDQFRSREDNWAASLDHLRAIVQTESNVSSSPDT